MLPAGPLNGRLRWSVQVDTHDLPEARVVSVRGRLGSTTAEHLARALEGTLAAGRSRLLLDLAGVDYLNSAGLEVIQRAASRARASGGALVICGLQEPVRVALEISGAAAGLALAADVAAACDRLRALAGGA